ncbi:MAG: DUF4238 domain-containing protein [Acidobacteriota bacterium]
MSVPRRHHYIPRFLLRRFASRRDGKKSWIWQASKDGSVREVSTRDAAVETDFHGGADTGIEAALSEFETRFSIALSEIDQEATVKGREETLRQLIWTLAIRTRAVRDQFDRFIGDLLGAAANSFQSESGTRVLMKEIESRLPELLGPELTSLDSVGPQADSLLAQVQQMLESGLPQRVFFDTLGEEFREDSRLSQQGQLKGLARVIEIGGAPESFRPTGWEIFDFKDHEIVLGDGCIVATIADGQTASLLRPNGAWENIYLPISPSRVLAAGRENPPAPLADAINRASAELSVSQFFCSSASAAAPNLVSRIGQRAVILDEVDMQEMFADGWRERDNV